MLQNGNLTIFRVVASAVISLISIGGGIWLLHEGVNIPIEYWGLAAAAIGGVVGVDVAASVIKAARGNQEG